MHSPTNKQLARGLRALGRVAFNLAAAAYREAERIDPRPEPEPLPDYEAMAEAEAVLIERARAAAKARKPKPDSFTAANDLLRKALSNTQPPAVA